MAGREHRGSGSQDREHEPIYAGRPSAVPDEDAGSAFAEPEAEQELFPAPAPEPEPEPIEPTRPSRLRDPAE